MTLFLLVTSCANSQEDFSNPSDTTLIPVLFDTYTQNTSQSRAAEVSRAGEDPLNLTNITTTDALQKVGFGVFGYYTDNSDYQANTSVPNFMYNQKVGYASNAWTYSPIKYWPNETGADASSEHTDNLSFFAYAPHITTPGANSAIQLVTTNSDESDPIVSYTVQEDPTKSVDFLYSIPNKDMVKQKINEKVSFNFHHALCRIGFTVVGAFDEIAPGNINVDQNTRITVESVGLTIPNAVPNGDSKSRRFNLNTCQWEEVTGEATDISLVTDKEKSLSANIADKGDVAFSSYPQGVTKEEQPLMAVGMEEQTPAYFNLFPTGKGGEVVVNIKYYVTTHDSRIPVTVSTNQVSRVFNDISNKLRFENGLQAGKAYNIKMILGMTTVKFEVSVTEWKLPVVFTPTVDEWVSQPFRVDFE